MGDQIGILSVPARFHTQRQAAERLERAGIVQVPLPLDAAHEDVAAVGVKGLHASVLVFEAMGWIVGREVGVSIGDPHQAGTVDRIAERRAGRRFGKRWWLEYLEIGDKGGLWIRTERHGQLVARIGRGQDHQLYQFLIGGFFSGSAASQDGSKDTQGDDKI